MEEATDKSVHRIGRYTVLGELGTGGMAVVYRAHDPRLDRDVAVKVLHPHLAKDHESRARFEREARAAARLRHPNIVEVYEFSEAEERESYMVTELLEGPTLRRFVEPFGSVPAEVAACVGVVLCDALSAAHAQGVVHRDVKPDNLMLQRGKLKLTDFGIAHVADGNGMTVTGQVLGSPAHMAPEQIEGAQVDARTDVFATGTVLYLLAVGKLPFEGTTAHALLRKILEGDYADPLRAEPAIGHRFAAIVRKALARDPNDRYPTAEAMRAALDAFVKEVGWEFSEQALQKFFEEPEATIAALTEKLKERLPQLGQEARKRNDVGDAMGYFNRALALDPRNSKLIAMVRSVARRRQMERALRTAGIVGGAAVVTVALAMAVMQSQVAPRVHPPTVMPEPGVVGHDPEPTTVIVRATEGPRALPAVVAEIDAGEPEASVEAPRGARREDATRNARAQGSADAAAIGVAQTLGPLREVQLFPNPRTVVYRLNGGPPTQWTGATATLGSFHVGDRIHIELVGDGQHERLEWDQLIPSGDGGVYRLTPRLRPVTADASGTVAAHNGRPVPVN